MALWARGFLRKGQWAGEGVVAAKQLARQHLVARWGLEPGPGDAVVQASRREYYSAVLTVTRDDTKAILYSGYVGAGPLDCVRVRLAEFGS